MNPIEFNRIALSYACETHNKCMEHLLDEDQKEYDMWAAQREHMIAICNKAAIASQAWSKHINRFNTHCLPMYERIKRLKVK